MQPGRSTTFRLLLAAGPALLALGWIARALPPGLRPFCLTHLATGYPCPGCGAFRALCLLAAGRLVQAFLIQPFMTLLFTAILLASAAAGTLWLLKRPEPRLPAISPMAWKWLVAGLIAALLVNWLYLVKAGI